MLTSIRFVVQKCFVRAESTKHLRRIEFSGAERRAVRDLARSGPADKMAGSQQTIGNRHVLRRNCRNISVQTYRFLKCNNWPDVEIVLSTM